MEQKPLLQQVYKQGVALGACSGFTEAANIEQIVEMLFSPQGVEFCLNYRFPALDVFRQFKQLDNVERLGVFIDCGDITLTDPQRAFLIGNTRANVNYTATQGNVLYLMHGAKASVTAGGYSVTHIEKDKTSSYTVNKVDNAEVL